MSKGEYRLFTDGGSRGNGNASKAACACFLYEGDVLVGIDGMFLGECTNNVAEYEGLALGVKLAIRSAGVNAKSGVLQIFMDSELVIKQLRGEYRIMDERLRTYSTKIAKMAEAFHKVEFTHVRREGNKLADRLVNIILDTAQSKG